MKEWKYRRETYYALDRMGDHSDDTNKCEIEVVERFDKADIIQDAINYTMSQQEKLYYPGKSYSVAIHYASWIQDYFGGNMCELLNDPLLLNGDDPYFVPYDQDKETYDEIQRVLDQLNEYVDKENRVDLVPFLGMTYKYFLKEFMLDKEGRKILPYTGSQDVGQEAD
jgi:hypothetical protein